MRVKRKQKQKNRNIVLNENRIAQYLNKPCL